MAKAIRDALALTHTPPADAIAAPQQRPDLGFDQKQVEQALGRSGKVNGGVLQIGVPRAETITDSGMTFLQAWVWRLRLISNRRERQGSDHRRLRTPEHGSESVMKTLRENGIAVTAVHSHMLTEEPRLFFMHFWANDDAVKLAKGLRAALDKTSSAK